MPTKKTTDKEVKVKAAAKPKGATDKANAGKSKAVAAKPKTAKPKVGAAKTVAAKPKAAPKAAAVSSSTPAKAAPREVAAIAKKELAKVGSKELKETPLRVLLVTAECLPFAGTGGLGEVAGSLPKALNQRGGVECRVILPLYECVPQNIRDRLHFVTHINVGLSWRVQYCGLFSLVYEGVTYYFIDNEYYFKRPNLYGYYDEAERYAFFCRAVLDVLPYLEFDPNILHCNDWQTALVPVYHKLFYQYRPEFGGIKTLYTIHNIEYQGKFDQAIIEDVLGIPRKEYGSLEYGGGINLTKAALDYSDYISTVSPTYANELRDDYFAHGLASVVTKNSHKMRGILNGIDTVGWNPAKDNALFCTYDFMDMSGKAENKRRLQSMLSLPIRDDVPLVAIVSRLVSHKGLDIVKDAAEEILKRDVQIVVLGTGDNDYQNHFAHLTEVYPDKFHAIIAYNKDLSHKIYGAADMFLMPSKSEPCGLSQMISARYGAVPIVRATGGLSDSIEDCGGGDKGIGFVFGDYSAGALIEVMDRALGLYRDYRSIWDSLAKRTMSADFGWDVSAKEYEQMYRVIL